MLYAEQRSLLWDTYRGTGAKPLCTAKCGSRRKCISSEASDSAAGLKIVGHWEPETVICRGIEFCTASGTYSLRLLFLVCPPAFLSLFFIVLFRPDSLFPNPWKARRFDWFAIAEAIDSPLAVMRAESAVGGIKVSREVGPDVSFLQGPGESPDMRGDGRGVTSAIAFNIGEDTTEFGAEPRLVLLPTLLASTFLILGVRAIPIVVAGARENSSELRAVLTALAAVTVHPGTSVRIRRPALRGLECPLPVSRDV